MKTQPKVKFQSRISSIVADCNAMVKGKNATNMKNHLIHKDHKDIAAALSLLEKKKEEQDQSAQQLLKVRTVNGYVNVETLILYAYPTRKQIWHWSSLLISTNTPQLVLKSNA